jgi:DNA-binding transcriptional LysR family regulator
MNLRSVDLNLLVALDALLTERHVTRAAERIGLSQPAMSNTLLRLRHMFNDELLIRTASGMQPTHYADELQEPVRLALRQIERVFESDADFDPLTATNRFVIRMSDLLAYLLMPSLLSDLAKSAPKVSLDVVHLSPARTVEALERDEIHIAVSTGLDHSPLIRPEFLFADRMVCVMRLGHSLSKKKITLEEFLLQRHLKVSISPTDARFVDDVLDERQVERTVAVNTQHWLLVPHILEKTDLVSVMPGRLATTICSSQLVVRPLPFASKPFDWLLYRHRRYDRSRSVLWLQSRIRAACEHLRV